MINTSFERNIVNIFLPISLDIVLGAQKNGLIETVLFEYPQHMFRLGKKKNIFLVHLTKACLCLGFVGMDLVISEGCYKGKFYKEITGK